MIGICTDSSAQLPSVLVDRYGIEVVPLTVTVDEHDYLEGVDLDPDRLYELLTGTGGKALSVTPPSSGQFAVAYDDLVAGGATEILSLHDGSAIAAARLAAHSVTVPVRLLDVGSVSFGVSCCAWRAAEAASAGASLDEVVATVESMSPTIGQLTMVSGDTAVRDGCIEVHTGAQHDSTPMARLATRRDAMTMMADYVRTCGRDVRAGVGIGDRRAGPLADALQAALAASANVTEVVRFRVGAAFAQQTAPGAVGCFVFAAG